MCACIVRVYLGLFVCVFVGLCVYVSACEYTCIYLCVCVCVYVCKYVCVCVCVCVCVYVFICKYVCVCVFVCVCVSNSASVCVCVCAVAVYAQGTLNKGLRCERDKLTLCDVWLNTFIVSLLKTSIKCWKPRNSPCHLQPLNNTLLTVF